MIDHSRLFIRETANFNKTEVIALYQANHWSSAKKPEQLLKALKNSHRLVLAYYDQQIVGLGNAISDGYLVVYYPHLLVKPEFQGLGIGKRIINKLKKNYVGFHQQILVADGKAIGFYNSCGFKIAGKTQAMWIYDGDDH